MRKYAGDSTPGAEQPPAGTGMAVQGAGPGGDRGTCAWAMLRAFAWLPPQVSGDSQEGRLVPLGWGRCQGTVHGRPFVLFEF